MTDLTPASYYANLSRVIIGSEPYVRGNEMAKKQEDIRELRIVRPPRIKLTKEEMTRRMLSFPERKEAFIASVRKNKDRDLHS